MSSQEEIFKADCEDYRNCGECYRIKVSDCAVPQGEPVTPVFGSLYASGKSATPNTNVDFDMEGPFGGVILDTTNDSITINSSGVYTISFSTEVNLSAGFGSASNVIFCLSINGTTVVTKQVVFRILI